MNSPSGSLASWFALAVCSNPLIYSTLLRSRMASVIAPILFASKVQLLPLPAADCKSATAELRFTIRNANVASQS
jgi:hypothetical protein